MSKFIIWPISHISMIITQIFVSPGSREVKLKGISTLKNSMQQVGVPVLNKEGKCDKAPLTKHE